jgi:hypothetical protein
MDSGQNLVGMESGETWVIFVVYSTFNPTNFLMFNFLKFFFFNYYILLFSNIILFFMFLYWFNVKISKINFKKYKKYYFNVFLNKKYFKKQSLS